MRDELSRREFLREVLLAGSGLVLGGSALAQRGQQMEYRYLGPSRARVSVIAGNETFGREVMAEALRLGVNYWHKANEMGHWAEVFAASGIQRRTQILEACMDKAPPARLVASFKDILRRLRQDSIEVYKMHIAWADEHVEAYNQLRAQGLVRTLAVSLHGYKDEQVLEAIRQRRIDHIQIRVTPCPCKDRDELLALCKQYGIGVIAMKVKLGGPKGWGKHVNRPEIRQRLQPYLPDDRAISVALIKYALAQPGVVSVVAAISSVQRLREDLQAVRTAMSEGEAIGIAIIREQMAGQVCEACYACQRVCPSGVAVADIMRYWTYATAYGRLGDARALYRQLPRRQRAESCDHCGLCEQVCSQGLRIRERLELAHQLLA